MNYSKLLGRVDLKDQQIHLSVVFEDVSWVTQCCRNRQYDFIYTGNQIGAAVV
jgi:hypothetical protein